MTTATITRTAMEDVTLPSADFTSKFGLDSFYGLPPSSNATSLPLPFSSGFNLPFASSFSSGSDDGFSAGSPTSDSSPSSPLSPQPYFDSVIPTLPSLGAIPTTPLVSSSPSSLSSSPPKRKISPTATTTNTKTRARKQSTTKKRETTKGTNKGTKKRGAIVGTASPGVALSVKAEGAIDQTAVTVPVGVFRELNHDQAVKKKRLQRKAELARLARRKKQNRMDELERIAAELTEENQRLKAETKRLQQAMARPIVANPPILPIPTTTTNDKDDSNLDQALAKLAALSASLSSHNSTPTNAQATGAAYVAGDESDKQISDVVGMIALALKKQNATIEQAVKVLQQALVPCTAMQFLEWSLAQKDQFYERDGLFMTLFRDEMGGTEEQVKQLLALRTQMRPAKLKTQELLDSFRTFEHILSAKASLQPEAFDQLRAIFTPKQLATYFKWVGQYGPILLKVPL